MRIAILAITIIALSIVGCRKPSPTIDGTLHERTTTIADLRAMVSTAKGVTIDKDIVVHGRVTTSDAEGNFSRTMVIEDETGALEILIAERNLSTTYPEGLLVALHLEGCAASYDQGVLQIGSQTAEYDYYDVGYIESKECERRIIQRSTSIEKIAPRLTAIANLRGEDRGRLVRIEGLTLYNSTSIDTLAGMTLSDATWQGYALFRSAAGDSIAVYTSPNATFADRQITTNPLSITGILQWSKYNGGKECYHLKMRYSSDYESI